MPRRPLKKSEQTRERCVQVQRHGGRFPPMTLCVRGGRYGFTTHLRSRRYPAGGVLPVPTDSARTLETAIKNAKRYLRKFDRKHPLK